MNTLYIAINEKNNSDNKQDEISLSLNNFPNKNKYKIIKLFSGKPR